MRVPGLRQLGYAVEASRSRADRIRRPVLFGSNGRAEVSHDIDVWIAERLEHMARVLRNRRSPGLGLRGLAAIAVIRRPDVFRAAVSGAAPSMEAAWAGPTPGARTSRQRGWPERMLSCLYLGTMASEDLCGEGRHSSGRLPEAS